MEKQHYKYGLIDGSTIRLSNKSRLNIRPLYDEVLEDVDVEFWSNGILEINAKKIEYDFYFSDGRRIFEEEWIRTPHSIEIKEGKRHFWSKKNERYVNRGFVKTTEIKQKRYIMSNFQVEIYD